MRDILLIIDMQNDFITGALGTREAEAIVDAAAAEAARYPACNIIATRDTHGPDYLKTQEGQKLPVPHCLQGTEGWALHPKIAAAIGDALILNKPSFGSVELSERLRDMAAEEALRITLIGLCTDICVVSNALLIKAFLPETPVRVIARCCAGVTPESHEAALRTMEMCQITVER